MIAALGMYDRPETAAANDRLWSAIAAQLPGAPHSLKRDADPWDIWQSPDLLFAQTCGMPYRTRLHGAVQLIGTPDYALPGCRPGHYNSVMVAHRDAPGDTLQDFAGKTLAYNEALSQSGWAAPMTHAGNLGVTFGQTKATGAHIASARAVAAGTADIAGLDALTWALIQRYDDFATQLRVVDHTPPTPGLPYITSLSQNASLLFDAVQTAIANLSADDRETLHLHGLTSIDAATYLAIPTPPDP